MEKIIKIGLKILKWIGIVVASILFLLFIIPLLFPGTIAEQVKIFANKRLTGKLDYKNTHLSFFRHFPSLTVSMDDLLLLGSKPFQQDTLLAAKEVAAGINLKKLIFNHEIKIDEIYITDAYVNGYVDDKGQANYNVFVPGRATTPKDTTGKGTSMEVDLIKFRNFHVKYIDHTAKILVDAKGLNYTGKGGLSEDIFDLKTDLKIDLLDFSLDQVYYAQQKSLHADLITRINTNALTFVLRKNELRINDLPLKFNGFVSILKDGYDININAASAKTTIRDMISVLPPQYLEWSRGTTLKGNSDLFFSLKGIFSKPRNIKPEFTAHFLVKNGVIASDKATVPMNNLNVDLYVDLPALNPELLKLDLKKLSFDLGQKNSFHAIVKTNGLSQMEVNAAIKGVINLQTLDGALGLKDFDIMGMVNTDIQANGIFNLDKKLFPKTDGYFNLKDGWLKTSYYPNPIKNINLTANVKNTDSTFSGLAVNIDPFKFDFEGNPVFITADLNNFEDLRYKVRAKGTLDVGRIYQVFKKKGLDVTGLIIADLSLNGRESYAKTGQYSKLDNSGTLVLKNIKATTSYLPKAFYIQEGNFKFENEKMWFRKFDATYGKSDFSMDGYLLNTINYFIERKGTLHGKFGVYSNYILVDEFMALKSGDNDDKSLALEDAKAKNPKSSGVVIVPKNLDVSLDVHATKVQFKGLDIDQLAGSAALKDSQLYLNHTSFDIIGSRMSIDARYRDESPVTANFDVAYKVEDFDVQRAYKEIDMVRELATAAKDVSGIVSLVYKLKGDFDANMNPIYPSLEGGGVINLKDVAVKKLKMLSVIGDAVGENSFDNPDMTGINIETQIKNNLIHINKFTFKVSVLRPSISGTASINGLLDILVRVGLPPAGWIGIPVAVTGTSEAPKIKFFTRSGELILRAVYNTSINKVIREEKRDAKKSRREQRKVKKAQEKDAKKAAKQVDQEIKTP